MHDAGYRDVRGGNRSAHPDSKSKHLATKYPDFNALRNCNGETQPQILGLKARADFQFPVARTTLQVDDLVPCPRPGEGAVGEGMGWDSEVLYLYMNKWSQKKAWPQSFF